MEQNGLTLERVDDPAVYGLYIRFDDFNEDSIQILMRDPSDGYLNQAQLRQLTYINDWMYPFRTMIYRLRLNHRNPFLFWHTLDDHYKALVSTPFGLGGYADVMQFFVWLILNKKITSRLEQRIADRFFNETDTKTKESLIKEYNESLQGGRDPTKAPKAPPSTIPIDDRKEVDQLKPIFLEDLSQPVMKTIFIRFEGLGLEDIQRIFMSFNLSVDDPQYKKAIDRFTKPAGNPYKLWIDLPQSFRSRIESAYAMRGLECYTRFFVWLINRMKLPEEWAKKPAEYFFNQITVDEKKEAIIKEYNEDETGFFSE